MMLTILYWLTGYGVFVTLLVLLLGRERLRTASGFPEAGAAFLAMMAVVVGIAALMGVAWQVDEWLVPAVAVIVSNTVAALVCSAAADLAEGVEATA